MHFITQNNSNLFLRSDCTIRLLLFLSGLFELNSKSLESVAEKAEQLQLLVDVNGHPASSGEIREFLSQYIGISFNPFGRCSCRVQPNQSERR